MLHTSISYSQTKAITIFNIGFCPRDMYPSLLFEGEDNLTRDSTITNDIYMPGFVNGKTFAIFDTLLSNSKFKIQNIGDTLTNGSFRVVSYDENRNIKYSFWFGEKENSLPYFEFLISQLTTMPNSDEICRLLKYHIEMVSICDDLIKSNPLYKPKK